MLKKIGILLSCLIIAFLGYFTLVEKKHSFSFVLSEEEAIGLYLDLSFSDKGDKIEASTEGDYESEVKSECFVFSGNYLKDERKVTYKIKQNVLDIYERSEAESCIKKTLIALHDEIDALIDLSIKEEEKRETLERRRAEIKASWENS